MLSLHIQSEFFNVFQCYFTKMRHSHMRAGSLGSEGGVEGAGPSRMKM